MREDSPTPVDSPEGIRTVVERARTEGYILSPQYRDIALRHGVSVENVSFSVRADAQ